MFWFAASLPPPAPNFNVINKKKNDEPVTVREALKGKVMKLTNEISNAPNAQEFKNYSGCEHER